MYLIYSFNAPSSILSLHEEIIYDTVGLKAAGIQTSEKRSESSDGSLVEGVDDEAFFFEKMGDVSVSLIEPDLISYCTWENEIGHLQLGIYILFNVRDQHGRRLQRMLFFSKKDSAKNWWCHTTFKRFKSSLFQKLTETDKNDTAKQAYVNAHHPYR